MSKEPEQKQDSMPEKLKDSDISVCLLRRTESEPTRNRKKSFMERLKEKLRHWL